MKYSEKSPGCREIFVSEMAAALVNAAGPDVVRELAFERLLTMMLPLPTDRLVEVAEDFGFDHTKWVEEA